MIFYVNWSVQKVFRFLLNPIKEKDLVRFPFWTMRKSRDFFPGPVLLASFVTVHFPLLHWGDFSFISLFWCSASVKGYTFDTSAILEVFGSAVKSGCSFWACTVTLWHMLKNFFPTREKFFGTHFWLAPQLFSSKGILFTQGFTCGFSLVQSHSTRYGPIADHVQSWHPIIH